MRARRVACGGVSLHVTDEGAGEPVLLLHGFTGSGAALEGVAAALRDRHRVVRPDLLGHGRSDAPHGAAAYAIERCAGQLAAVLDALGIGRAHVLGYSMGGRAGLAFAALHPERVASALLLGARAGIADPVERAARVRDDERLAERIEREGVEAFVDHWMALPLFDARGRIDAAALAASRRQRLACRAHGLAGSLRGMGAGAQPPLADRLPQLAMPILFAAGAEDARFAAIARDLAARAPNARVALVPEAGHAAHLENPAAFARLARDFFAAASAAIRSRAPTSNPEELSA